MRQLTALQMVSTPNVEDNLLVVENAIKQLSAGSLIVLPECFACFGAGDKALVSISESLGDGLIQAKLAELSKRHGVWIVAGTIPLKTDNGQKYTASSLVFNDQGDCVAEYQKIHLFDVMIEDSTGSYLESKYTQAGKELVVIDSPFGKLGLAVCYDIRFAGMFQAMQQIDVLVLPSAFTRATGAAHWHALIQARAIEKQCYLVAANQGGMHANGRETYGHSSIVSPWGAILDSQSDGEGMVSAHFDYQELKKIRRSMPVHQHNQFRSHFV